MIFLEDINISLTVLSSASQISTMAVTGWAVTTATLLLLLTICCDATQSQSLCQGETCHISPGNFWQLQDIISSNRLIMLNGVEFSVNGRNDFIVIENVSNLTISGGESGSLIECSPQSTFGLHLKNATNVTLSQIRIRYCGSPIANRVTSLLIEVPRRIILSGVHIEYSPGLAMEVIDLLNDKSEDPFFFMDNVNPNLMVTDCNISRSREHSIVIRGSTSLLIERTVIANSEYGIESYSADIMMKNVDVINCTVSYLVKGRAMVKDRLTMYNSSLNVFVQDLHIQSSSTLILTENINAESILIFYLSNMYVTGGSSLLLQTIQSET